MISLNFQRFINGLLMLYQWFQTLMHPALMQRRYFFIGISLRMKI
ncbi:hypothetical protein RintRC_0768 [Richelia intracellularis]|nr:hypothetical protein RintRC_0768 [Richelia intracellularis]